MDSTAPLFSQDFYYFVLNKCFNVDITEDYDTVLLEQN